MNSMKSTRVWDLVELPINTRAIGCKWIFKIRINLLSNIKRYMARLIAKGFTQKKESITHKLSLIYLRKILCILFWH